MEESEGMRYSVGLDLDGTEGVQRGVEWGSEGWWDIGGQVMLEGRDSSCKFILS